MKVLLRMLDHVAELALYGIAGFAAATLAADEPEPEWDRESLDRLLEAVHQAQDDADWVMWRQEFIDD